MTLEVMLFICDADACLSPSLAVPSYFGKPFLSLLTLLLMFVMDFVGVESFAAFAYDCCNTKDLGIFCA